MTNKTPSKGYACFELVTKGKDSDLCCVKYCRKDRVPGRRVCYNHHIMAWRINHPVKAAYATLRDHAVRRKLAFTITLEQFTALVVPSGYIDNKGCTKEDLHIDRIDALKGYVDGNLQILTCSENATKGATKDKKAYAADKIARHKTKKDLEAEAHAEKHLRRFDSEDEEYNPF